MAIKKKGLGKGLDALLGDAFAAASETRKVNQADAKTYAPKQQNATGRGISGALSRINSSDNTNSQSSAAKPEQPVAPNQTRVKAKVNEMDIETRVDIANGRIEQVSAQTPPPAASRLAPAFDNSDQPKLKKDILVDVPVELCQRGKYQPRRDIDQGSLEELAASIKSQGVMQPIIIRSIEQQSASQASYEIIAGERRWRAAQLAGLTTVPAVVKEVPDEAAMAMAVIENLQREDLNPMEEAYALARLNKEFELTHQQVADIVGKSRAAVSNALRLMNLHKDVKLLLENGDLEMGHARALLALDTSAQGAAAKDLVDRSLSVRQTEAMVKSLLSADKQKPSQVEAEDPNITTLQNDLSEKLGVPVSFKHSPSGAGKLTLKYNSLDELDGILNHIK